MTTRLATRPADEERFRDFKARRLAKKEADREKLATQFPLLFNNKSVGNKLTNTNLSLNKSATVITPGKRKSTFIDKNDENCALSANKPNKTNVVSKTPLSSKKQRKGSLILSPKAQVRGQVGLSKTLPSIPTYTHTAPESTTIIGVIKPMEVSVVVDAVPQSVTKACTAAAVGDVPQGVELTTVTRKALFEDSELEKCTSTRSSLSSLGDSIIPEVEKTAVEVNTAKENDASAAAEGAPEVEAAVEEQVLDVLDYLLELDEMDEQTYRRMSSQSFSAKAIKRLSMTMQPWTLPGSSSSTSSAGEEEENTPSDKGNSTQRSSASVSMEVAYPDTTEGEDCVIGELDVLNALRNYLATMDKEVADAEQEKKVTTDDVPINTEVAIEEEEQLFSRTSARSSASSAGTFTDKPEWRDSLVPSGRQSCTTTMRVSFLNSSVSVSSDVKKEQDTPMSTSSVVAAEHMAPKPSKAVVTYPLRELLDDALQRGLVVPAVTRRIEMGNHTKYVIETQILSVPGYPEENSKVRMMCMKRYSDFKTLRTALIEAVETQHRIDARNSTGNSLRSSLEGSANDILSIARSRRSSVESDRDSLLLNARDSLCAENVAFSSSGRPSEVVPPLPSRQVMSMSCASLQAEQDFQESREAFLASWVEAVFARQSCECAEFRLELRKFLTA